MKKIVVLSGIAILLLILILSIYSINNAKTDLDKNKPYLNAVIAFYESKCGENADFNLPSCTFTFKYNAELVGKVDSLPVTIAIIKSKDSTLYNGVMVLDKATNTVKAIVK